MTCECCAVIGSCSSPAARLTLWCTRLRPEASGRRWGHCCTRCCPSGGSSEDSCSAALLLLLHRPHRTNTAPAPPQNQRGASGTSLWLQSPHLKRPWTLVLFMPKIIRILRSCSMKIFCKFPTVNISKLNFWLVICIAKNFIWTTLKMIFSIFWFFCTLRFQIYKYCPIITNHTSMESYLFSFQMMHKSQFWKIDPYDWFCAPGSHMLSREFWFLSSWPF